MIVPVIAISNLVLTQQIYSEERNGAHAHYREPVPLNLELFQNVSVRKFYCLKALITLGQVNTTEWLEKNNDLKVAKLR